MANAAESLVDGQLRHRLRVRHLLLLSALGQSRSLHRAARQLRITQPGASKLLAEIERLFGVPLFNRTSRGVLPTSFGDILVRSAEAVLGEIDNAEDEIRSWAHGERGRIRVGVFPVAIPELLVGAVMDMLTRHPNVDISIEEGASETMLPALRRGELDCLLGRIAASVDADAFACIPLYEERICVVAGGHHRLAKARRLTLKQVKGEEWILPHSGALLKLSIDGLFTGKGLSPPVPKLESSSFLAIEALLRRTDCLSLWPSGLARDFAARGLLSILPLALDHALPPVGIFLRKAPAYPPFLQNFLDAVQRTAASIMAPAAESEQPAGVRQYQKKKSRRPRPS